MKIIVEGADGSGKSTLVKKLAKHYKCDILQFTEFGSKEYKDYYAKLKLDNVVFDRSFISEMIYPEFFGREMKIKGNDASALLMTAQARGFIILILTADDKTLVDRLIKRGDEYDFLVENTPKINQKYKELAKSQGYHLIDDTMSLEEIIKIIDKENDTWNH